MKKILLTLLLAANLPAIAVAEDWSSCSSDAERISRDARDIIDISEEIENEANDLEDLKDELDDCKEEGVHECRNRRFEYTGKKNSLRSRYSELKSHIASLQERINIANLDCGTGQYFYSPPNQPTNPLKQKKK